MLGIFLAFGGGPALRVAGGGVRKVRELLSKAVASREGGPCLPAWVVVVVTGVKATVVVGTVVTETLGAAIESLVVVSFTPALVVLGGVTDDLSWEEVVDFFLAPKALLLGGFMDFPKVRVGGVFALLEAWDFSGDLPTTPLNCSGSVKSS